VAVLVDLDRVRNGPPRLVRSGIGDVVNNLSAVADWELAAADRGEPVDGLAVTLARTAAQAVLHQPGTIEDDDFLTVLAESLILSGMAMTVAGSSRPASGGCHEIRTRSTSSTRAPATTASWPGSAPCSAPSCAGRTGRSRSRRPAWPGTACRAPRPTSG